MKVLLAGPIETKGRYKGGIASILNAILAYPETYRFGVELIPFDTCRTERSDAGTGRLNFRNLANAFATCRQLRKQVRSDRPDVIYFNTSRGMGLLKDVVILRLSGCRKRAGVVLHVHNAEPANILPHNGLLRRFLLKSFDKRVDHLVLLSKTLKEHFVRLGLAEDHITVIYNFHTVSLPQEDILRKIESSKAKPVKDVLFLGSLSREKGVFDLLDAVTRAGEKVNLHIGGVAREEKVQREIEEIVARMDGSVELLGYVSGDAKLDQLRRADILALPSYAEGFPVVLPEAMAAGCAILTTDVGAIPEFFTGENGVMLHPGDVDALAAGLTALCRSASLGDLMLYNWRMSGDFVLDAFLTRLTDVCRQVMNA